MFRGRNPTVEPGHFNDLPLYDFPPLARGVVCSNSTNTCKVGQAPTCVLPTFTNHPKSLGERRKKKSYVSNKPINIEQTDCSLSELKWAARCVLSRQLNFRQLNILGNVWKLNCEGEQRQVARMKRCGETQKALSYRRNTQSHTSRGAQTHTCATHTHPGQPVRGY